MSTLAVALAPLSLHRPASLDFVRAAAAAGYAGVGLQLLRPGPALAPECTEPRRLAELRLALHDLGLGVLEASNVELTADFDPGVTRRVVEVAAELGARYVQVTDWDPEPDRLAANLATVCDQAGEVGLEVAFEFMPYSSARTLEEAGALLATAARPGTGLVFDVLHFARSGGTPGALREGPPSDSIAFVQICDARPVAPPPDRLRAEALADRLAPGEGSLPLREVLAALSPLPPISVEAPVQAWAGLPLEDQARRLLAATVAFVEQGLEQQAFRLGGV